MESIDWNPVIMAIIALISVTAAPLVTLYVGNQIRASNDRNAAAAAAQAKAAEAAAVLAAEELKKVHEAVNSSKSELESKLAVVSEKLGLSEIDKATLAEQVRGDEQRREREAKAALEEKVRVAEAAVPPAPVVGTPTAAPAEPPIGTATNPIPIVLQAEQVDAKADVVNVAKEGPQPDGS